ncbi:MAG: 2-oxoacid:ferredoxin oxidoreductase subunit beta, partial [Bacteroidota bacterium]|nr:2-oxoacid:ferredoxin oxidoreductase subunit beta [Bacteroidota bacterium]
LFDDQNKENPMPRPFGIFFVSGRPTMETKLNAQVALAKERKGEGDLDLLLSGDRTWTIG